MTDAESIEALAVAQLEAYNLADIDAFAACYHPEVAVYDGEVLLYTGRHALRERYGPKFAAGGFGATVDVRVSSGVHCVDREQYWTEGEAGRVEGEILVRYTLREGCIGVVQFLRST